MSLQHVQWKYVGSVAFASATVASVLDAVYVLGTTGSYADATPRSQGAGSAWSFTGNTFLSSSTREAVWCYPPSPSGSSQVVLMAGSAINSPTGSAMASPDLSTTNNMFVNITKGSGSFNNWTLNPPITGGTTFGWWKTWITTAGVGNAFLWESKECIAVILNTSTGTTFGFIAGAIIDPESSDAVDAESDGRLYGIICSGPIVISTSFATSTSFLSHIATNSNTHSGVFTPSAGTIIPISINQLLAMSDTTTFRTTSGKFVRQAITMRKNSTPFTFIGRLRDVMYCTDGKTGQKLMDGATTIGYLLGSQTTSDSDQIMLENS